MKKFHDVKIGFEVVCSFYGEGVVDTILPEYYAYPIIIQFKNGSRCPYNRYGKMAGIFTASLEYKIKSTTMEEQETFFTNAKKGDKVYSLRTGWGEIINIYSTGVYQVFVHFETGDISYTKDGKIYEKDLTADLYWNKPEIVAPPPPKRKVEKKINVWVNHNSDDEIKVYLKKDMSILDAYYGNYKITEGVLTYTTEE